jgi:AsmA protein
VKGRYSDAFNGRYTRLYNEGILQVKDFAAQSNDFPLPVQIKKGLFRFSQDKMWFERFMLTYGKTTVQMNGYMQNVPAYLLTGDAVLAGKFNLQASLVDADQLMVAVPSGSTGVGGQQSTASAQVLVVPGNLDLQVSANVKKLLFNGVKMNNLSGLGFIRKGYLTFRTSKE